MALKKCNECGGQLSTTARNCPHCGAKHKIKMSKTQIVTACVIGVILGAAMISADKENPQGQIYHAPSDPPGYVRAITTAEFQADKRNIVSKRVSVIGYAGCLNDVCLLMDTNSSATVTFDASDLPVDTKERLYDCPLASTRCLISVTGLGTPDLKTEMLAYNVIWQSSSHE